jgi:alanine dehydrogenase
MKIGSPKEIKNNEYRIGLTPSSVKVLVEDGHEVFIETKGGEGIGCSDDAYIRAGAKITSVEELFISSELIIKVKEPVSKELDYLN